jgi:alpha-L-fucosidase
VDLGAPIRVDRVVIDEGDWNRVRRFEIAAEQEGGWRTVATGTTLGPAREISFPPATARVWRLHILDAVDVPTILEFEVYTGP